MLSPHYMYLKTSNIVGNINKKSWWLITDIILIFWKTRVKSGPEFHPFESVFVATHPPMLAPHSVRSRHRSSGYYSPQQQQRVFGRLADPPIYQIFHITTHPRWTFQPPFGLSIAPLHNLWRRSFAIKCQNFDCSIPAKTGSARVYWNQRICW